MNKENVTKIYRGVEIQTEILLSKKNKNKKIKTKKQACHLT